MATDARTTNRTYPKPHPDNLVSEDMARLILALEAIDVDVAGLLTAVAGRALASHAHAIADVTGLQTALDGKKASSWFPSLDELTDVSVSGAANGQFLRLVSGSWQGATISVAWSDVSGKPSSFTTTWSDVSGKPSTFAPSAHTHAISEVTSLQTSLDANAAAAAAASASAALKMPLTGGIFSGTIENRAANYDNYQNFRMTGETGLTNDLIALSSRRIADLSALEYYEYGFGSFLTLGAGGKVGVRNTAPAYPLDVNGDLNVSGNFRWNGVKVGVPLTHQLSGFLPECTNANTIRFYNGVAAYGGTNPTGWVNLQKVAGYVDVDLTVTGAGGRDTGTLASMFGKSISFYAIGHATDPTLDTVIASLSVSLGGVVYPSGYAATRAVKLPFEAVYFPGGVFHPFHVNSWPLCTIWYSDWSDGSPWNVLSAATIGTANVYENIDVSGVIPYSARLVWIHCTLEGNTGGGNLLVSVPGVADDKPILSVAAAGQKAHGFFPVRTSSLGVFQWTASSTAVRTTIRPIGYTMSEL